MTIIQARPDQSFEYESDSSPVAAPLTMTTCLLGSSTALPMTRGLVIGVDVAFQAGFGRERSKM